MKQPFKFFAGLVGGFLLVMLVYAVLFHLNFGVPTESSRWCFEINQKKCQTAARINSPKLLLVGGSGTLFGIRAGEIQGQTGRPTVNLGTHAVLGVTYLLREARQVAKPGDTVLLTFEYELYAAGKLDPTHADTGFLDYILARDPDYFRELSLWEQWDFFMLASTRRLQKGLKNLAHPERPATERGVYDPQFLNDCGDQTHNLKSVRRPIAVNQIVTQTSAPLAGGLPVIPPGFEPIAAFCEWAKTNHIRVLATYPNICDKPEYHQPHARQAADRIRELFGKLNVPVLGDYTDSILPPDSFFDTMYHPTEEASLERTRNLLPKLKPYLDETGK